MDFFIPGVALEDLRVIGLRLQRGGIGFYPTSGSPFVHLDVGSVRHWPTMSREELVRIFPNGRTVHVPSDGRPLPGYALALADVERQGNGPSAVSLAAARNAGAVSGDTNVSAKSPRNAFAKFFGFGRDEDDDVETTASIGRMPAQPTSVVAAKARTSVAAVATPKSRPGSENASAPPAQSSKPQQSPVEVASADFGGMPFSLSPWPTPPAIDRVSPELALAYAAQPGPELTSRPAAPPPRRIAPVVVASIPPATSVAPKQALGTPTLAVSAAVPQSERFDDPWLRAAILAPNFQYFLTAALSGPPNSPSLNVFMQKPASSVAMAFSDDANFGLAADHFSGEAVVFVATTAFNARTASLR
jgi:hypothetical protein